MDQLLSKLRKIKMKLVNAVVIFIFSSSLVLHGDLLVSCLIAPHT